MRRVLPIAFVMLLGATVAFAGVGRVGAFGDAAGTTCVITQPPAGGTFYVYLVHIETDGVFGASFWAPKPACLNASHLADINAFPVVVGTTQTGYGVGYGTCKTEPFLVCSILFTSLGPSSDCCVYYILPDPNIGPNADYEFSNCDFETVLGGGKAGVVNQTAACSCEDIPTEDSSWGKIKALYSQE